MTACVHQLGSNGDGLQHGITLSNRLIFFIIDEPDGTSMQPLELISLSSTLKQDSLGLVAADPTEVKDDLTR